MRKQLVDEVTQNPHGEFGKHPGSSKLTIAYGQKNYYPNIAQLIRQGVMSCEQRIEESPFDDTHTTNPAKSEITLHSTRRFHST